MEKQNMHAKLFVLALAATVTTGAAHAETKLGFPIGEKSAIHTNLDLGVAYDSNFARLATALSDWRALIRPGLAVDVPGSSLAFRLASQLTVNQFFGTGNADTVNPDKTRFGGDVTLNFRAGSKRSPVALSFDNVFARTPTFFETPGAVASDEFRTPEWYNRTDAKVTLRPGGGALELDVGYENNLALFYENNDRAAYRHGAVVEARLRFLPKTFMVLHLDGSLFTPNDWTAANSELRSAPYHATVGLAGLITRRLGAVVSAGIGDAMTFEENYFSSLSAANQRTVVGTAQLTYDFNEQSTMSLGYNRDVKAVLALHNYRADSIFVSSTIGIGPRLSLGLLGRLDFRRFGSQGYSAGGTALVVPGENVRVVTGDVRLEYWFFEFLNASLNYRVMNQDGDGAVSTLSLQDYLTDNFTRHQGFFSLGLEY